MALSLTKLAEVKKRGSLAINAVSFVDQSGSMTLGAEKGERGTSRWDISHKVNAEVTGEVCKFDDDGIDLVFFNDRYQVITGVTEAKVRDVFARQSPGGGTSLANPLRAMVDKYLPARLIKPASPGGFLRKANPAEYEKLSPEKPVAFLIWTDGCPSDRDAVQSVIIDATCRIKNQKDFGMVFIQVGHDDGATKWLAKQDNDLASNGAQFDCVAVVNYDEIAAARLGPADILRLAFTG